MLRLRMSLVACERSPTFIMLTTLVCNLSNKRTLFAITVSLKETIIVNKKNYNMILSCYNYGRVTIIYDAIVNY